MEHANDTFKIVSMRQWRMDIVQSCYSSIQIVNFFDYWNIRINRGMIRYKATTKQTISEDTGSFLNDVRQSIIGNSVDTHWRCSSSIKETPQSNFIDWIIITTKNILIRGYRQLRSSNKLLLKIIVVFYYTRRNCKIIECNRLDFQFGIRLSTLSSKNLGRVQMHSMVVAKLL